MYKTARPTLARRFSCVGEMVGESGVSIVKSSLSGPSEH